MVSLLSQTQWVTDFKTGTEKQKSVDGSCTCRFFPRLLFLAPLTLAPGTVNHLDGRANAIDFYGVDGWGSAGNQPDGSGSGGDPHDEGNHFAWSELNPYAGFIYAFGDLNCHQKHERSWELNGNQLPVCVRDIGIFAGLFLGALVFTQRGWNRWTVKDTCLSLIPDAYLATTYKNNRRTMVWIACGTLLCLPDRRRIPTVIDELRINKHEASLDRYTVWFGPWYLGLLDVRSTS